MSIKRGEIYLAALDPVIGSEISKTRPVVVISNNINNQFAATVSVLPVTSKNPKKIYPFEVFLPKGAGQLPKDSKIKADQIRTLDKSRLISRCGSLADDKMDAIDNAVKIHLGLR